FGDKYGGRDQETGQIQINIRFFIGKKAKEDHSIKYPIPFRVTMNSSSPSSAIFLRIRLTFTVSVLSSTNCSSFHSACMKSSRETILPIFRIINCKRMNSFRLNSVLCPLYSMVELVTFNFKPRWINRLLSSI